MPVPLYQVVFGVWFSQQHGENESLLELAQKGPKLCKPSVRITMIVIHSFCIWIECRKKSAIWKSLYTVFYLEEVSLG